MEELRCAFLRERLAHRVRLVCAIVASVRAHAIASSTVAPLADARCAARSRIDAIFALATARARLLQCAACTLLIRGVIRIQEREP
jgi:hypothetical protein